MTSEDDALAFASAAIASLWALELLLFLKNRAGRAWSSDELVRELRSSETAIAEALGNLRGSGLVSEPSERQWQYRPPSDAVGEVVDILEGVYRTKPASVIRAIVTAPADKLRLLSDAFRIKE